MNTDTSLAAWMIAGGPRTIDPSDARNVAHRRELAAIRGAEGPTLATRIGAAISALRTQGVEPETAGGPA
jgi:hypothetical protein